MSRSLRITVILVATLAALHTARGAWGASTVGREFSSLASEGLLKRHAAAEMEPAELRAARKDLDEFLTWIGERSEFPAGPSFNHNLVAAAEDLPMVWAELDERRHFFDGVEALPSVLWAVRGAPGDAQVPRLMKTRTTANALCVQAWVAARGADGGLEAGRSSARALAIARVVDTGGTIGWMIRESVAVTVFDNIEGLLKEGIVARADLLSPLAGELRLLQKAERFDVMLATDVAQIHEFRSSLPLSVSSWLDRPGLMEQRLRFLREYRRLKEGDPQTLILESYGEADFWTRAHWAVDRSTDGFWNPELRVITEEEQTYGLWAALAKTDRKSRARIQGLLRSI